MSEIGDDTSGMRAWAGSIGVVLVVGGGVLVCVAKFLTPRVPSAAAGSGPVTDRGDYAMVKIGENWSSDEDGDDVVVMR